MSEEELNKLCEEKWGFSFTELDKIREYLFDWVVLLKGQKAENQERIDKAIEYIKSYNSTIKSRNELGIYVDFMSIPKELLEILGDKENENNR